ncbi:MAG: iron-containing alcohol dehydrogenase [Flavobacteriales bacterium]|nr:iron-containing alcohol dehydrogenase [Flavobacteriales bacterium]
MKNFTYCMPTRVVFGAGESENIGKLLACKAKKVLLHYGMGSAVKSGLIGRVKKALDDQCIQYVELGGVHPNPRLSLVRKGIEMVHQNGIDTILAVGGGSVIDSSKAISIGSVYQGDVWDFYCGKKIPEKVMPVAVVLTIPAAGSEASNSSVITNDEGTDPDKRGINYDIIRPVLAVMDPTLTYSIPAYHTAAGGVDIMAHVMERYFTNEKNVDFTDRMCEATMKTIIRALPMVLEHPDDYSARAEMMWASTIAHNDLLSTGRLGDWASHRIAHQPSALYDLTHGAALCIIFPAWMKYVYKHDVQRFVQYAVRVWGVDQDFNNPEKTALEGIHRLEEFIKSVGMPSTFSDAGISYARFEQMADRATGGDTFTLGQFVPLTKKDIYEIYHLAL